MNIYSSPLDLYLASACQLNAQKNPASFIPSASFLSQLDPLSQQKYLSLLSSRQQQQAERLNDPNLYTYAPMKKVKAEHHSSNLNAASNTYGQEVPSQERELFNKLTNHSALNYSNFPAAGPLRNSQPSQRAFPSQHVQEQKSNIINLDSDDEDCVVVEKQAAAPLTVPPQLNYHNMNLPPSFSDFISKNHLNNNNNNFNRNQFPHPVSNLLSHQNNFYQNRPYAGVASLQGYNSYRKEKEAIVIEEEENHDDTSHTTANSAHDNRSNLTLPGYQNNYYLQQMLNSRFQMPHMPPQMPPQMHSHMTSHMHFNNQLANMKQMWAHQQQQQAMMNYNSQNLQNDLKIITKVEEKEPKEIKEKKKLKKKPRSPKKRAERKIEIPLGPETMQADMKLDEPYVIELHIDPNDPNPNVCDTMVGDEFQTNIPPLALNKGIVGQKRDIRCRWNPDTVEREKLLEYFGSLEKRTEFEITSEIAKIRLLKDNEYDVEKSLEEVDKNLIYYKGILKLTKRRGRRSK